MLDFTEDELYQSIKNLSQKKFDKNYYFGNGDASKKIVKILKELNYKNTEKVYPT